MGAFFKTVIFLNIKKHHIFDRDIGAMIYNQLAFDIKMEWGLQGLNELAPVSTVVIIVDVLSFSTSVDIATANGAMVYPYHWKDERSVEYARSAGAELAQFERGHNGDYNLSPSSLLKIPAGTKLVLPSPNGSTLAMASKSRFTICGCLRNARAVAAYAMSHGQPIAVIPAGERWCDNTTRFAYEDLLGAGAIIGYLKGSLSPECKTALAAFNAMYQSLATEIKHCCSGMELIDRGFEKDIDLACMLNESNTVPVLRNKAFVGLSIPY